jgi:hypothetical protein
MSIFTFCTTILVIVLSSQGVQGTNDAEKVVPSSPFQMVLYPTFEPLDMIASNKASHAIKTALLLSASVTTNFLNVEDFTVVLQNVQYQDKYESSSLISSNITSIQASLLNFNVEMSFANDDDDAESSPATPSRFALDNLIVRTFSQPSSKSSFIVSLGLARDPILKEVTDIEIHLADEPDNQDQPENDDGSSLSNVDIILIVASVIIFIGIFCVICYFHNSEPSHVEEDRPTNASRETRKALSNGAQNEIQIDAVSSEELETNDTENGSPKAGDEQSSATEERRDLGPASMMPEHESNIIEGSSLESSIDDRTELGIPDAESSDVSYASSSEASSSDSSSSPSSSDSSSDSSTTTSSGGQGNTSVASELLGAERPDYSGASVCSSTASSTSGLAARLLNLSGISASFDPFRSSASAPPILQAVHDYDEESKSMDDRSIKSARSASSESWDSIQQVTAKSRNRLKKHGYWNPSNMLETAQQFHENWLESKRKALEDIEEGSVEDVFQIDVERTAALQDTQSKSSALTSTSVSEWMKSVRVVSSASETQSSVEHSSVEPRSYTKENSSLDLSLEQSMAGSLVGV